MHCNVSLFLIDFSLFLCSKCWKPHPFIQSYIILYLNQEEFFNFFISYLLTLTTKQLFVIIISLINR